MSPVKWLQDSIHTWFPAHMVTEYCWKAAAANVPQVTSYQKHVRARLALWRRPLQRSVDAIQRARRRAARARRGRCGRCQQAACVGAAPDGVVAARAQRGQHGGCLPHSHRRHGHRRYPPAAGMPHCLHKKRDRQALRAARFVANSCEPGSHHACSRQHAHQAMACHLWSPSYYNLAMHAGRHNAPVSVLHAASAVLRSQMRAVQLAARTLARACAVLHRRPSLAGPLRAPPLHCVPARHAALSIPRNDSPHSRPGCVQDHAQHPGAHPHSSQCVPNRAGTRGVRPAQRALEGAGAGQHAARAHNSWQARYFMYKPHQECMLPRTPL